MIEIFCVLTFGMLIAAIGGFFLFEDIVPMFLPPLFIGGGGMIALCSPLVVNWLTH